MRRFEKNFFTGTIRSIWFLLINFRDFKPNPCAFDFAVRGRQSKAFERSVNTVVLQMLDYFHLLVSLFLMLLTGSVV